MANYTCPICNEELKSLNDYILHLQAEKLKDDKAKKIESEKMTALKAKNLKDKIDKGVNELTKLIDEYNALKTENKYYLNVYSYEVGKNIDFKKLKNGEVFNLRNFDIDFRNFIKDLFN